MTTLKGGEMNPVTVFLCGDVMPARGVDQILPCSGDPALREPVVDDARTYVALAEKVSGPIPRPVDFSWPWGVALPVLEAEAPDVRLINLETSVTAGGEFALDKQLHYRMSPGNLPVLTAVRPDACALANNHVLDFGVAGLTDTLGVLNQAGLRGLGAGYDVIEATEPVIVPVDGTRRVVIFAAGMASSGVPRRWAATGTQPGVSFVRDLSGRSAAEVSRRVLEHKRPGDVGIVSLHWGTNWGYRVDPSQVRFAHRLIDAGVDVVYGHSSHHPRPIEVYRNRLILYGCGDAINDYEGIPGHSNYRDDLRLLYFASFKSGSGELASLRMLPLQARKMRLEHPADRDVEWLRSRLDSVCRPFGVRVGREPSGMLQIGQAQLPH
ncbi:CapA family protein [Amycolatopsis mongoliensis]|uniref:CapA family protein n=1 Tax=Amycolatopsis mongoliensis TaxID=715475 RepID=A0A9Y2NHI8_9PSEU|nr:CapA family protein [Amycolatopsis sp. 4-36]WIX98244.1 CapA family protein [Amycolatopsis sp. 4-36]